MGERAAKMLLETSRQLQQTSNQMLDLGMQAERLRQANEDMNAKRGFDLIQQGMTYKNMGMRKAYFERVGPRIQTYLEKVPGMKGFDLSVFTTDLGPEIMDKLIQDMSGGVELTEATKSALRAGFPADGDLDAFTKYANGLLKRAQQSGFMGTGMGGEPLKGAAGAEVFGEQARIPGYGATYMEGAPAIGPRMEGQAQAAMYSLIDSTYKENVERAKKQAAGAPLSKAALDHLMDTSVQTVLDIRRKESEAMMAARGMAPKPTPPTSPTPTRREGKVEYYEPPVPGKPPVPGVRPAPTATPVPGKLPEGITPLESVFLDPNSPFVAEPEKWSEKDKSAFKAYSELRGANRALTSNWLTLIESGSREVGGGFGSEATALATTRGTKAGDVIARGLGKLGRKAVGMSREPSPMAHAVSGGSTNIGKYIADLKDSGRLSDFDAQIGAQLGVGLQFGIEAIGSALMQAQYLQASLESSYLMSKAAGYSAAVQEAYRKEMESAKAETQQLTAAALSAGQMKMPDQVANSVAATFAPFIKQNLIDKGIANPSKEQIINAIPFEKGQVTARVLFQSQDADGNYPYWDQIEDKVADILKAEGAVSPEEEEIQVPEVEEGE